MKKLFTVILSIILNLSVFAQSGWVWKNPLPQGNEISDIQFLNSTTGYASTFGCSLMKTTDAGLTWQHYPTGDSRSLSCCFFINENTGFIGGDKLKFKKTTDGCKTWSDIQTGIGNQFLWIGKIKFIDHNTGYFSAGSIYKTTNAGINWSYLSTYAYDFQFFDANTGYVVGSDGIYNSYIRKTTNGGNTWQTQYSQGSASNYKIQFFDANTGYACMQNLLKTTNGGVNWILITNIVPPNNNYINTMDFINASTGFLLGGNNFIARTTNGGTTWDTSTINSQYYLTRIKFSNSNNGIVSGYYGTLYKTSNSGLNWINLSSGFTGYTNLISGIQFVNESTGYITGGYKLFGKTTDGGNNWNKLYFSGELEQIGGLYFFNSATGFVFGNANYVLKTSNSGANWTATYVSANNIVLMSVKFNGPNTGFTTATDGKVFRTTNGGLSWYKVADIYNPSFTDVSFADANTVFVCGSEYGSPILKSTNLGQNWESYNTNVNGLWGILFVNNLTGFCAGSNGSIFKTTNCGANWFTQVSGTTNVLGKIFFTNLNTGYIISSEGEVIKTTNSGNNWIRLPNITNAVLRSLYFINNETGFIVGDAGCILKTTTGGVPIGIQTKSKKVPVYFSLSQNYPNPFNPSTNIKFQIAKLSGVKLIIYDVLGREITTLINEQLKPGTYETEWDGSNYSSGVYFYKLVVSGAEALKTADYTETRKMVLIK